MLRKDQRPERRSTSTDVPRPYSSCISSRVSMRVPCIARLTYPNLSTFRRLPRSLSMMSPRLESSGSNLSPLTGKPFARSSSFE